MANDEIMKQLEETAKEAAAEAVAVAREAGQAKNKATAEEIAKRAMEAAAKATEAVEKLEKLRAEAEAKLAEKTVDPAEEALRMKREAAKEKVVIQLFKDAERYKDDVAVFVNGESFLIQRGVPVEVPRYVAEVINNSQRQDSQTEVMVKRLIDEYEAATAEKTKVYGA